MNAGSALHHLRREGPMAVHRLAWRQGRDDRSVHGETSLLIQTGLIARTAQDEVRIGRGGVVAGVDLVA